MPRRVLITGASGVVGTSAMEEFLRSGWDVVAVSRRKPEVVATRASGNWPSICAMQRRARGG